MLRHISIIRHKIELDTLDEVESICYVNIFQEIRKKTDSDKNWEIYTSLKFSLGIKVQQRLAEPLVSVRRDPRGDAAGSHMS